jgi:hypothetical protein
MLQLLERIDFIREEITEVELWLQAAIEKRLPYHVLASVPRSDRLRSQHREHNKARRRSTHVQQEFVTGWNDFGRKALSVHRGRKNLESKYCTLVLSDPDL